MADFAAFASSIAAVDRGADDDDDEDALQRTISAGAPVHTLSRPREGDAAAAAAAVTAGDVTDAMPVGKSTASAEPTVTAVRQRHHAE